MDLSQSQPGPHAAAFRSSAIYYTFAFSLPPGSQIHRVAKRLLKRDLAQVAQFAALRDLSFSHRFKGLAKLRRLGESLGNIDQLITGEVGLIKWGVRNPRALQFLISRKMLTVRLFERQKKRRLKRGMAKALAKLRKGVVAIDKRMLNTGLLLGVASEVDRELFAPGYLDRGPFIRLDLGTLTIESPQQIGNQLSVLLLLHHSGTALLSFVATCGDEDTDTDSLLGAYSSSRVKLKRTILPESLGVSIAPTEEYVSSSQWVEDEIGVRTLDITWNDAGIPLGELFDAYARLISNWKEHEFGEWSCYTTMFIDGLGCCGNREVWMSNHSGELAGLIRRDVGYALAKQSLIDAALKNDLGLDHSDSRYFSIGNALIMDWAFGDEIEQSTAVDYFWTTHVVENALLQYWQLRSLDNLLARAKASLAMVASAQLEVISGLEEYRVSTLLSGDARDIERQICSSLDVDRIYSRILERLGIIQQLHDSRRAQTANTRTILIAASSVMVAAVLGIPAIKDVLTVAGAVNTSKFPGVLASPLVPFARAGNDGIWALYLIVLAIFAGVLGITALLRARNRSHERYFGSFGIPWRSINYSLHENEFSGGRPLRPKQKKLL